MVPFFTSYQVSLRDALRQGLTDEEMLDIISSAVKRKKQHHAGMTPTLLIVYQAKALRHVILTTESRCTFITIISN